MRYSLSKFADLTSKLRKIAPSLKEKVTAGYIISTDIVVLHKCFSPNLLFLQVYTDHMTRSMFNGGETFWPSE